MKAIPDTNLLVRMAMRDDPVQERRATDALRDADLIAVTLPTLCEFCWVLGRGYKKNPSEIAHAVRTLMAVSGVQTHTASVEAGLAFLDSGADFADGVIAHEGRQLGGDVFITFDKDAAAQTNRLGYAALLLR